MSCDWCGKYSNNLVEYGDDGIIYQLCKKCIASAENNECITCKDELDGIAINGECSACQQIRATKSERHRSEILNGLGIDTISELTHSMTFTESDYEKWVTLSQGNFTPEIRKMNRMRWLKRKLMTEFKWDVETFNANVNDIEKLFEQHSSKIFKPDNIFVVKSRGLSTRGLNIVAVCGNIVVLNTKEIEI